MWTWNGRTGNKEMAMKSVRQMLGLLLCALLVGGGSAAALEKVVYFHNDALGSPVAATNAQGQVLWTEAYDPYGTRVVKPASAKANHLWYTGKQEETELGLNYFGARWYEPGIGRFHGIDPIGFTEGNVQSFNRYTYGNNNPYRYADPDGKWAEDVVLGLPSVALGAHSLYSNAKAGNWGSAAVDAGGIVADGIAILVPGLPGGVGLGIKATREAGKGAAERVASKFVETNPKNLIPTQSRNEMSGSLIKRLEKDMKQSGFNSDHPVDAVRREDGRLEIVDGHHRTEAAKRAGIQRIPVRVLEQKEP